MAAVINHHPVNLSLIERVARVVVGAAGAAGAVIWFAWVPSVLVAVGAVVLAAAGIDLIVTGVRGYCPLYAWLARRGARRSAS
ncbi:MAG: DUF2892 domain-containing protein [Anaerolinea sp.]|nr:DUF2892 domain-containing protein [Anaerolinea sp.]